MSRAPRESFTLVFEPAPSQVPVTNRVKRLLKYAGRCLGLRCVSAVHAERGGPQDCADAQGQALAPSAASALCETSLHGTENRLKGRSRIPASASKHPNNGRFCDL